MTKYITFLQERKPVIFTGDLNVGHLDLDIHNPEAKHIVKQAGLTPQERASFSNLLAQTGCRDAFRFFHSGKRLIVLFTATSLSKAHMSVVDREQRSIHLLVSENICTTS